ncbi:caspase family protein, partial [Candidatus Accumulibacter vicinus]|uniref:caspase family protein n=1 Tax=Candidatus Accumulibacter vicinus TaxID=2954382 RepID=UPI00235B6527
NVAEDGQTDHSPFTEALLKNLAAPGLEVRQMLTRVRQQVKEQTNGKQIPWDHSSLTQDFYFIGPTTVVVQSPPAPAVQPPPVAGVDPMAVQLSLWESVRTSQDPADFED